MKALAAALIVLLILGLLGWFTLSAGDDEVGAAVNTDVVKEDVVKAGEVAGKAGEALGEGAKAAAEEIENTDVDVDVSHD